MRTLEILRRALLALALVGLAAVTPLSWADGSRGSQPLVLILQAIGSGPVSGGSLVWRFGCPKEMGCLIRTV